MLLPGPGQVVTEAPAAVVPLQALRLEPAPFGKFGCGLCGFTVDGELWQPDPDRSVALSADRVVHFVRA